MVKYTCPTCSKEFTRKSSFIDHTEHKKKPCKPIINIINNIDQKLPFLTNLQQNNQVFSVKNEKKENICKHCDRTFTTIYTLNRHLNGRCKKLKENEIKKENTGLKEIKQENLQLKKEIEELKKQFNEFINNNKEIKESKINKNNIKKLEKIIPVNENKINNKLMNLIIDKEKQIDQMIKNKLVNQ